MNRCKEIYNTIIEKVVAWRIENLKKKAQKLFKKYEDMKSKVEDLKAHTKKEKQDKYLKKRRRELIPWATKRPILCEECSKGFLDEPTTTKWDRENETAYEFVNRMLYNANLKEPIVSYVFSITSWIEEREELANLKYKDI